MEMYTPKFNVKYELKDNGDTTQNLYARSYQNSSLICETDFGDISQIITYKKENDDLKQALNEIREICNYYGITPEENDNMTLRNVLKNILQIIDKVLGEEK